MSSRRSLLFGSCSVRQHVHKMRRIVRINERLRPSMPDRVHLLANKQEMRKDISHPGMRKRTRLRNEMGRPNRNDIVNKCSILTIRMTHYRILKLKGVASMRWPWVRFWVNLEKSSFICCDFNLIVNKLSLTCSLSNRMYVHYECLLFMKN